MSYPFKICDSVHGFIRFGPIEREVIDSPPFQRLRYIHQMAVAYLVYPGATHSRFEHSLGVMELVTRIYNTLMAPHNQVLSLGKSQEEIEYWELILRLAALCHDMGHLPFSHTAERSLLPEGGHEGMTLEIIRSPVLQGIWGKIGATAGDDIAKLSVTQTNLPLSPWEKVLSKVITEDSFGADRIDYLIRDGHYTGVGYGHFDYHQLIDCLRILPERGELTLGVTESGIQSVESLWIARYMMYARVYQHHKARAYSNHLHRFMRRYYPRGMARSVEEYLEHTDYTLLTAIAEGAKKGDYDAQCLLKQKSPFSELALKEVSLPLMRQLEKSFGEDIFIDEIPQKEISSIFPVYMEDGKQISCFEASPFLRDIPSGGKPLCLYVHPQKEALIQKWLRDHSGSFG
jgi:uncharacterized protein